MKHQILAAAGLVAVMAFCGYMVMQMDTKVASAASAPSIEFAAGR